MKFYYKYKPEITNIYNTNLDLNIVAVVHIYVNEEKTDFIMQMPFTGISFKDVPNKTIEGLKQFIEEKIEEQIVQWQQRLEELVQLKQLGLYNPIEPNILFEENLQFN